MKKVALILILTMLNILPCNAGLEDIAFNTRIAGEKVIFTYHIPEEDTQKDETEEVNENLSQDDTEIIINTEEGITSDDVTADTSGLEYYDPDDETYEIDDMYSDVLYGYAQYIDDNEDTIFLENSKTAELNLKKSQISYSGEKYNHLQTTPTLFNTNKYSKYNVPEFSIATIYQTHQKDLGAGFSAGTTYWQGISDGELEQSSGLFSRYQYKRIALTTTYSKTINTTNNTYSDNIYFTPELKLNQYLTLKEILSTNVINHSKKAEFMISLNPFGNYDQDRLRLNLSAVQTFDDQNNLLKNQFKFYTNYKF